MRVAVFCGSKPGNNSQFINETKKLGHYFAQQNIDVVYGGGHVGLMGAVADATLEKGGKVYGVIPHHLESKEIAHEQLTELTIVADMHERKAKMAELADAFVALPGGIGTLEEIFEAWTWAQLGYHNKPCAFFNIEGYYDPLLDMIKRMKGTEFLAADYADMLIITDSPKSLVEQFKAYRPPAQKWK